MNPPSPAADQRGICLPQRPGHDPSLTGEPCPVLVAALGAS